MLGTVNDLVNTHSQRNSYYLISNKCPLYHVKFVIYALSDKHPLSNRCPLQCVKTLENGNEEQSYSMY